MTNKCVSRTDTNPPFAFQTAFPRGTDFTVFLQGGSKRHTLSVHDVPVFDENGLTYCHSFFHHTLAQSF